MFYTGRMGRPAKTTCEKCGGQTVPYEIKTRPRKDGTGFVLKYACQPCAAERSAEWKAARVADIPKLCRTCKQKKPRAEFFSRLRCLECKAAADVKAEEIRRGKAQRTPRRPRQKVCGRCMEEQPRSAFKRDASRPDGLYPLCRTCTTAARAEYYATRKDDPGFKRRMLAQKLKRYGLSVEAYERMSKGQRGCCRLCRLPSTRSGRPIALAVDHDHVTGKTRGLLCCECNTFVGRIENRPDLLVPILIYLKRHGSTAWPKLQASLRLRPPW